MSDDAAATTQRFAPITAETVAVASDPTTIQPEAGKPDDGGAAARRLVRLGVAGALATFLGLALVWLLAVPLFLPADENAHVDYIAQMWTGTIPKVGSFFHAEFASVGQRAGAQHTTNHPPLYYVITSPLVHVAEHSHHPRIWLLMVRGVGVLMTVATIVLIAVLARSVLAGVSARTRNQLTVLAAGLAAAVPSMVIAVASVQNDAPEVMFTAVALVLLAVVVRRGPEPRYIAGLAVVCALGMLTRSTFLQVLVVVLATMAVVCLWPDLRLRNRPTGAALGRAAASTGVIVAVTVAASGWFYLMNKHRYHDFTGGNAVYALVHYRGHNPRAAHGMLGYLVNPHAWWVQVEQLGGTGAALVDHPDHTAVTIAVLLCALAAVGLAMLVSRRRAGGRQLDRPGWLILAGCLVILLISFAEIADHVTNKGSENNRYLLDGLPFWGIAAAAVFLAASPRRAPVAAVLALGAEIVACLSATTTMVRRQAALTNGHNWFDALVRSMHQAGVPEARVVLVALLALTVAGLAVQAVVLVRLGGAGWEPGRTRHARRAGGGYPDQTSLATAGDTSA